LSVLKEVKETLRKLGIRPSKRLGQHFLIRSWVLDRLVDLGQLAPRDAVLDVGAGLGILTQRIAASGATVVAVEKDPRLAAFLREKFSGMNSIIIIEGDVLTVRLPWFNKVVSSPPYNISSTLLLWLCDRVPEKTVLLLQKEFADRLCAAPGTKNYSRLTLAVWVWAEVELHEVVPRSAFFPPPDVVSRIVELTPRMVDLTPLSREYFLEVVRMLFSFRRKTLRRALRQAVGQVPSSMRSRVKGLLDKRVYQLSPEEFHKVATILFEEGFSLGELKTAPKRV